MSFVRVAISVGLLLAAPMLFADNAQKIIPVESDVYTALTALYLEEGFAPPSQALPYSVEELQEALGRIDRSRLSAAGKKTYDFVESFFSHGTTYREGKNLEFSSAALVTVAGYAQTNPAAQGASAEPEWVNRPALVDVPLELWLWSSFYAYLSIPLMQDRFVAQPPSQLPAAGGPGWPAGFSGNPTNIPLSVANVDFEFPLRAFMALGGSHWELQFGRDKLSWGNGVFGNLLLAPNPDYYDFVRFSTYWRNFKFTAAYIDLPPYWAGESSLLNQSAPAGTYASGATPLLASKLFMNHRLEFRIRDRATLALSEGMILYGTDPTLSYWNPLLIFHNWNVWQVANDIASVELSVNPFKWLTLYGQFAMNKVGGSIEIYQGANNTPSAFAYLGGAQGEFPIQEGFLEASMQWTKTDPWFYIGGSPDYQAEPWLTFEMDRKYLSNFLGADPTVPVPTGWLYGPDSLVWNAALTYRFYGHFSAGVGLRIQRQGDIRLDSAYYSGAASAALTTPSGANPTDTRALSFFGQWNVGKLFGVGIGVGGDVDLLWVQNVDHIAGQNTFNTQFSGQVSLSF